MEVADVDAQALASSAPAVVRGADERRFVRRRCITDAARQTMPIGLLTLPLVSVSAMAVSSENAGRGLLLWIAAAAVIEALVAISMWHSRRAIKRGQHEHAVDLLQVAYTGVGCVWGAMTWVIDWQSEPQIAALLMMPLVIAVFMMVQAAPVISLFRTTVLAQGAIGAVGLLVASTPLTFGLLAMGAVWLAISERMVQSLHTAAVRSHQLQWRSDELVRHLRSERERLADANERLADQAVHDPLTGLLNRRGVMNNLESALDGESSSCVGVLYLDVDLFKRVNDTLGHRAGDEVLETMARRIRHHLRPGDLAGRLGGDEMVVIVPQCTRTSDLLAIATRLRVAIAEPIEIDGHELQMSTSIGVAWSPDHGSRPVEVLRSANEALHRAKNEGRNRVVAFDESLRQYLESRERHDNTVRDALAADEIGVLYVPEFDAVTGALLGAELLPARSLGAEWEPIILDELGPVSTLKVLTAVFRAAHPTVDAVTDIALQTGFRFRVALGGSLKAEAIAAAPAHVALSPRSGELCTVSLSNALVSRDVGAAASAVGALRALGVRVALDEVSPHSPTLPVLQAITFDEIRIDRNGFDPLVGRPADRAILRALVGIARDLGMTASAVGIDSAEQSDAFVLLGCRRQQGLHFSTPIDSDQLVSLVQGTALDQEVNA